MPSQTDDRPAGAHLGAPRREGGAQHVGLDPSQRHVDLQDDVVLLPGARGELLELQRGDRGPR